MSRIFRSTIIAAAFVLAGNVVGPAVVGSPQTVDPRLQSLEISVEAFAGQPFGVGVVTIAENDSKQNFWRSEPAPVELQLLGPDAFFPAAERVGTDLGEPVPSDERRIYFLFQSGQAKSVSVLGSSFSIKPVTDDVKYRELLSRWWKRYVAQSNAIRAKDQYPAQIEQYLTQMLAGRLQLAVPEVASRPLLFSADAERHVGIMTGTEAVRLAMQKDSLLGTSRNEAATEDLPKAASPPPIAIPEPAADVEVEAIAMVVPLEYLYARFTKYEDLEWFGERLDQWGTELNGAFSQRGLKYDIRKRVQDQLNLQQSAMAKQLSAAVVKDYAVIGTDTFLREGAGIGVLFHATSSELLSAYLTERRVERTAKGDGVTLSEIKFDGLEQTGSLLASPDNRVRSIYVISGDFHLVTTSKTIARRFLETCADTDKSLGASKEFRYARTVTPVTRNDTAFLYLSDQFFRTFVDPAFRIEMTRRASSESELELVELAILAANSEQRPHETLDELVSGGFLPPDFLKRADGSHLELKDGRVTDSLRGVRGSFLPVPDVSVSKATKTEIAGYEEFSAAYRRIWTWMDPATLAFQRHLKGNQEQLVLDMHMYPYPRRELGWLEMFAAQKHSKRLAPVPDVLLLAEANIFGVTPAFAGVVDMDFPVVIKDGEIDSSSMPQYKVPFFIGGGSGFEAFIGKREATAEVGKIFPIEKGRALFGIGAFGLRDGDFSIESPAREGLEPLIGKLALIDADRPAEMRLHVGDVSNSNARRLLHAQMWVASNRVSQGHVSLLNRMVTQFHVQAKDSASAVERVLKAELQSPLGGDYQPNAMRGHDSFIIHQNAKNVADFEHPLFKRLRGAEFELTTEGTTLTSHVEILLNLP